MNYRNLELHNINDVREAAWPPNTYRLQRLPEDVRLQLNEGAQGRALSASNAEIRFVCEGPFKVHLRTPNGEDRFQVAFGPFLWRDFPISDCLVEVGRPPHVGRVKPDCFEKHAFSRDLVRILLPNAEVHFVGLEAEGLRAPAPDEVPGKRLLCCGTSITQGASASRPYLSYAALTAHELGCDLINLGFGGSFHAEPELADYVASREDWDLATVEISVNMVGAGFSDEAFRERTRYFINTLAAAHPEKPVFCITLYPYFNDLCTGVDGEGVRRAQAFREILREEVSASTCSNIHLIEGAEILDDPNGLSADLIHPSDYGMARMAANLAKRLRPYLES